MEKIACVGDSITYGMFIFGKKKNSYPAQLQQLLGENYRIKNFGKTDYCLQRTSNKPYTTLKKYKLSLDFKPNIVLLMLGTNDSKDINWKGAGDFINEYKWLISQYEKVCRKIYLLTPSTVFKTHGRTWWDIVPKRVDEMADAIRKLAYELKLPLIDIHKITSEHKEFFKLDGVHPNKHGAKLIANFIYKKLK
jgi:lysophospholipase L1-like esterase